MPVTPAPTPVAVPTPIAEPTAGPDPTAATRLRIAVSCRDVWVRPGGTSEVRVHITRPPGTASLVELNAVNLPDGVTAESALAEGSTNVATVVLHAPPNAPFSLRHGARIYAYAAGGQFAFADIPTRVASDQPPWITGFDGAPPSSDAPGELDSSFGDDGVIASDWRFADSVELSDQSFLVEFGKRVSGNDGSPRCTGLLRMGLDGRPTEEYGDRGAFLVDLPGETVVRDFMAAPDGSIIMTGIDFWHPGERGREFVGRVTADGTWDRTFGDDGVRWLAGPSAIAVQSSGDFVVAAANATAVTVSRFLVNGMPDASFGDGGTTTTTLISHYGLRSVRFVAGGKILVEVSHRSLLRYDDTGTLDPTFGIGGIVEFRGGLDFAIDDAGYIYFLESTTYGTAAELKRLLPDGALDTSFGTDGRITAWPKAGRIAIHDDRVLLVGSDTSPFVVRLLGNGDLDETFGDDGVAVLDLGASSYASSATVVGDRLVVSGTHVPWSTSRGFLFSLRL